MSKTCLAPMDFDKMFLNSDTAKKRRLEATAALSRSRESIEGHIEDAHKFLFLLIAMYNDDSLVTKIREVITLLNRRDRCKYMVVPLHFALGLDENGIFGLSSYDSKLVREKLMAKHILQSNPIEKEFVQVSQMSVESIVDTFEGSLARLSQNIEQNIVTTPTTRRRAAFQKVTDASLISVAKASALLLVLQSSRGALRILRR